jgi:hypothetical protein
MKLAIMQPYFFPYLGYFQLIHAVDTFVVYDDVNFINRGWINRNYILSQGKKTRITLQLCGASQNKLINQLSVGNNRNKLLKTINQSYAKAPHFSDAYPLFERILTFNETNLAVSLNFGLRLICDYLEVRPRWLLSSELQKDNSLRGQDKILAICKELNAKHYINLPGGKGIYDQASFDKMGIKLSFIEPNPIIYSQGNNEFISYLSIVDVLMFNNRHQCQNLIKEYKFV